MSKTASTILAWRQCQHQGNEGLLGMFDSVLTGALARHILDRLFSSP